MQVVTKLTQAPQVGRSLSVATGDAAGALANAARAEGQVFTAKIPKALIELLKTAKLAEERTIMMGGVQGKEIFFSSQASEFIVKFFQ